MNRVEPNRNVYVGHRYVPLLVGEWDKSIQYEGLSIVTFKGASYTSKKMTPPGIDIGNEEYWVVTGNYDAQVEYYRLETKRVSDDLAQAKIDLNKRIDDTEEYVDTNVENLTIYVNDELRETKEYVDSNVNDLTTYVNDEVRKNKEYVDGEVEETKKYVNDSIDEQDRKLNSHISDTNDNFNTTNENHENLKTSVERKFFPINVTDNVSTAKNTFINKMNEYADNFEMYDTTFINPHGLRADGQEITARDLLLLGIQSMGYPKLNKAMGTRFKDITIKGQNQRTITIRHTIPPSIYEYVSEDDSSTFSRNYTVLGGKTGSLGGDNSVANVVMFSASRNYGGDFISAVVNSQGDRYMDAMDGFNIANSEIHSKRKFLPLVTPYNNGHFINDLDGYFHSSGKPVMDYTDYLTYPASVNVDSDGESQQLRFGISNRAVTGDVCYIYAYVKIDDYTSGDVGFQISHSTSETFSVSEVTREWVKVSARFIFQGGTYNIYFGSLNNAELKGKIDTINFVNLTEMYGRGNEPSKNNLDNEDHMKIQNYDSSVITTKIPPNLTSYTRDNMPIYYELNADEKYQPASVTKLMTGMITLDYFDDLSLEFELIESDISRGSGSDYEAGDIISLYDALHSLMMESSNTIATALSRIVGTKIIINNESI